MPPEKIVCNALHDWPKCADPDCVYAGIPAGAIEEGLDRNINLTLRTDELDYLARLVNVDQHRMTENADHATAYGARGYQMPAAYDLSLRLLHSFAMARTAAVIAVIEEMERNRADVPAKP